MKMAMKRMSSMLNLAVKYNPKILTADHFFTIWKEKEKENSTSSVNASEINDATASPSINGTTSHPSPRNTSRPKIKRNNRRARSKRHKATTMQAEDTVINLSNVQLSQAEIKLLSRGLTFVPTPQRINWPEVQADINEFARRLRLREFFFADNDITTDSDNHPFRCKSSWTPPCGREPALDTFINQCYSTRSHVFTTYHHSR